MTVTKDDFEKVWASSSPLTPYSFTDSNYKEGWNFVGSTPPSRQMWDAFMQNADEKLKYLYQHEDVPIGHEYFTFNPNIPQGSLPLFGGEYDRATYPDLWNWVQQQTGYLKTEAEWQTLSTANNGNVPYYSDGDGSTTFRVPSLKCWVRGANGTVTEAGSYLAAGLPNITGNFQTRKWGTGNVITSRTGAFYNGTIGEASVNIQSGGQNEAVNTTEFDASRSNSIYGNSATVQPESIVGLWLVKAYGVIVDTGTIDEQQYIDDRLATKLSLTGGTMFGAIKGDSLTLTAENGGNSASLVLNNSGSATWNGKEVERVNASGTGYIRYESGLQICFDTVNVSSDGSTSVSFYAPFISVPSIQGSVQSNGGSTDAFGVKIKSPSVTGFNITVSNGSGLITANVLWFAIGYWK